MNIKPIKRESKVNYSNSRQSSLKTNIPLVVTEVLDIKALDKIEWTIDFTDKPTITIEKKE